MHLELNFLETLVTFGIVSATDLLLQNMHFISYAMLSRPNKAKEPSMAANILSSIYVFLEVIGIIPATIIAFILFLWP